MKLTALGKYVQQNLIPLSTDNSQLFLGVKIIAKYAQ